MMDGADWLERILAPALRHGSPARSILRAQTLALQECGVLDAAQAAEAMRRIDASRPSIEPPTAAAPPPTSRLVRVLAPALPIADIDRVTYVLTSVELWEHAVDVFVAGMPSAVTARREREAEAALNQWAQQRHHLGPPPDPIRSHHLGVLVSVGDDLGTPYRMRHASMGGSGAPWRLHATSSPGVPPTAKHLVISVNDDDARPLQRHVIDLTT
jgi:hypothetical protein